MSCDPQHEIVSADSLLILGASTRAAAHSAVRAGLQPVCADLFHDEDLTAVSQVLCVERYPSSLPEVAKKVPNCPWMYVGALENHPQIIAEISADRALWGNPDDVIRAVRDPFGVHSVLSRAGFDVPGVLSSTEAPAPDGRWLLKPLNGSAGRGICVWNRAALSSLTLKEACYFQRFKSGTPLSALFLAMPAAAELIGISRQLIGESWLGASAFGYCGSLGPIEPPEGLKRNVQRIGNRLATEFRLRGLFGVDLVFDGERVWPVEINPRYTASVELFELAGEVSLLGWHANACAEFETESVCSTSVAGARFCRPDLQTTLRIIGKAILYADQDFITPNLLEFSQTHSPEPLPLLADIPPAGSEIMSSHPICTVFATAQSEEECYKNLKQNVQHVRDRIGSGCRSQMTAQNQPLNS
ncbi:MAG: ATP-grasp domain-containing protein [Planctomycetes bacterium]|nr:ATP-grasp domain-containing protein [Planctomycetota bacterium]